jgi:hypothetical protein
MERVNRKRLCSSFEFLHIFSSNLIYIHVGNVSKMFLVKCIQYKYIMTSFSSWGSKLILTSSQVASRRVLQVAGLILLVCGMIGKFGAVLTLIPDPIIGGSLSLSLCSVSNKSLQDCFIFTYSKWNQQIHSSFIYRYIEGKLPVFPYTR